MFLLHGARGHVVHNRVAEHVVERVLALDVLGVPADDDAELALVVDRVGRIERGDDLLPRIGERGRRLGEDHRIGRHVLLVAGLVDAALGEFARVVVVILADADHVLGERADRRRELGAREADLLAVARRRTGRQQLDDVAQVAQRAAADRKRAEAVALDGAENLALRGGDGCDFHGAMADLAGMPADRRDARKGASKDGGGGQGRRRSFPRKGESSLAAEQAAPGSPLARGRTGDFSRPRPQHRLDRNP